MVARIILTEPMLNQIGAALDARSKMLVSSLVRAKAAPPSSDRDFAVSCNEEAIRDTILARLVITAAYEEDIDFPADASWTEPELREAYGR